MGMADAARSASPERKSGCGLLGAVFGRRGFWARRTASREPLPTCDHAQSNPTCKRRDGETTGLPESADRIIPRPSPNHCRTPPSYPTTTTAPSNQSRGQVRKVPKEVVGISGELESMIAEHQRTKGSGTLVRASSSNVMLFGNLGNLRQHGNSYSPDAMDPVSSGKEHREKPAEPSSFCRALSTRMDPETLKIMGNEDYKNGRFAEALALYDAAISIDPNKASYRSNKSAALTALGRLLEAAFECREAIRIEPDYHRAHHRLGSLYLRLGEAEKAVFHYKRAGPEADPEDIAKANTLQAYLNKCTEAKKQRDWSSLLTEAARAVSAGADSAPQIFGLQAEALLKLRRHVEADEVLTKAPKFDPDDCRKFFGPIGNSTLLVVRAQVDLAAGRFNDAVASAQQAVRLDSTSREAGVVARKARAVAAARANGNELFKACRFAEACAAYAEGLEHDPHNAVLLCNRAACESKLGEFERAVSDCSAALTLRPSYSKARLRRADCNAKLERWEACVRDYEIFLRDNPGDEEATRALSEAASRAV